MSVSGKYVSKNRGLPIRWALIAVFSFSFAEANTDNLNGQNIGNKRVSGKATIYLNTAKFCFIKWFGNRYGQSEKGFDVELAEAFGAFAKMKVSGVMINWTQLFEKDPGHIRESESYTPYLFKRSCDFFAVSLTQTSWRSGLMDIVPIYSGRTMVVVRPENRKNISEIGRLKNLRVAVKANTTYSGILKALIESNPDLGLKVQESQEVDTIDLLKTNKVDFIFLDTIQALYFINKFPSDFAISFPASTNERIGWGFAKKNVVLSKMFRRFIEEQKSNPGSSLNRIFLKYFGITAVDFDSLVFSSIQH